MKSFTTVFTFALLLFCNMAIAQAWPPLAPGSSGDGCVVRGNIEINGSVPPNGSKIAFLNPELTEAYAIRNISSGLFLGTLRSFIGDPFVIVVFDSGTGLYYTISSTFTTNCDPEGAAEDIFMPGFDNYVTSSYDLPLPGCGDAMNPGAVFPQACLLGLLPVEFLSFTAKAQNDNTVRLEWATVWEEDNDYFTVERSIDGANFEALGTRDGAGTTIERQNYDWTDESPLPGINYYRIKQTDFDGAFSYSDVTSVRMNGALGQEMRIFPNPAEAQVRISLPSVGKSNTAIIRVFNHVGQAVLSNEQSTEGQLLELDTSSLPSGVYTLQVQAGARNYSEKLVVR
jgi:hypothetical protein